MSENRQTQPQPSEGPYDPIGDGIRRERGERAAGIVGNRIHIGDEQAMPRMPDAAERDHRHAVQTVQALVKKRQVELELDVTRIANRLRTFGEQLGQAVGPMITIDEMIDALKLDVGEELEKLRRTRGR